MDDILIRYGRHKIEIMEESRIFAPFDNMHLRSGFVFGKTGSQVLDSKYYHTAPIILTKDEVDPFSYCLIKYFRIFPISCGRMLILTHPSDLGNGRNIRAREFHGPHRDYGPEWEITRGKYYTYLPNKGHYHGERS